MRNMKTPIPIRKMAPVMPAIVIFGFGGLLKLTKGNPVETNAIGVLLLTFVLGIAAIIFLNAWVQKR